MSGGNSSWNRSSIDGAIEGGSISRRHKKELDGTIDNGGGSWSRSSICGAINSGDSARHCKKEREEFWAAKKNSGNNT